MTELSRRQLLGGGALVGGALALGGCDGVISAVTQSLGQVVPDAVEVAADARIDLAFHLLSRAAYGPWPGDLAKVRALGTAAWVERQLKPEAISDRLCDLRARRFETLHHAPGTCFEYKKPVLREEIVRHTLLRAVYSRRQLFEVMVGFWTDHLNIDLDKGDCIYLKPSDDREVVRRHALGRVGDLIRASATSPAMLVYLDGTRNKQGVPNENYARELLELHTLGVHGGYTQRDVVEAARCLTGWRVRTGWRKGTVAFDPGAHDDGAKTVLGQTIPAGGGRADVDRLVEICVRHPSTATYIATKLVRRLVAVEPPKALVERVAAIYRKTDGQIKPMLREILGSAEFAAARGTRLKRPFRFLASALRAVGADTHAHRPLLQELERLGQSPFHYPTPDGYPEEESPWLGTLLWRWNLAFGLGAGTLPGVGTRYAHLERAIGDATPARAFAHLVGRRPDTAEQAVLDALPTDPKDPGARRRTLYGLLLASPAFQRC